MASWCILLTCKCIVVTNSRKQLNGLRLPRYLTTTPHYSSIYAANGKLFYPSCTWRVEAPLASKTHNSCKSSSVEDRTIVSVQNVLNLSEESYQINLWYCCTFQHSPVKDLSNTFLFFFFQSSSKDMF